MSPWLFRPIVFASLAIPHITLVIAIKNIVEGNAQPLDFVFGFIWFLLGGFGITVGFHRYATHESFKTNGFVKALLLTAGSMAGEGTVIFWVSNHLTHHGYSDRAGDPHSPWDKMFPNTWLGRIFGFLYAHMGWLFDPQTLDRQKEAYKLLSDPLVVWINRLYFPLVILSVVIPMIIQFAIQGSWENGIICSLSAMAIRYHVSWAVNSVCHTIGTRPFRTTEKSTNNFVVGIFGLGEGWHNNHHAFPSSAFHGLRWWEFDLSGRLIRLLETLGLAWDVKRPTQEQIALKLKTAKVYS